MEATRLCPYCLQPLPGAAQSCPHCGKSFAGRNPGGTLPVGTVLAGRYTVRVMGRYSLMVTRKRPRFSAPR